MAEQQVVAAMAEQVDKPCAGCGLVRILAVNSGDCRQCKNDMSGLRNRARSQPAGIQSWFKKTVRGPMSTRIKVLTEFRTMKGEWAAAGRKKNVQVDWARLIAVSQGQPAEVVDPNLPAAIAPGDDQLDEAEVVDPNLPAAIAPGDDQLDIPSPEIEEVSEHGDTAAGTQPSGLPVSLSGQASAKAIRAFGPCRALKRRRTHP